VRYAMRPASVITTDTAAAKIGRSMKIERRDEV
jgi:hypothetical protein